MKPTLLKSPVIIFIMLLCALITCCPQAYAQVNGFVYEGTRMNRFSFDNPKKLVLQGDMDCGGFIVMANRPWMFNFVGYGSMGRFYLHAIDTATGISTGFSQVNLEDGINAMAYDNLTNAVYYFTHQGFRPIKNFYLHKLNLTDFKQKVIYEYYEDDSLYSLAAADGIAYAINGTGILMKINLTNGKRRIAGYTGLYGLA